MAAAAYLYIDKPVTMLQLDLDTDGAAILTVAAQKNLDTNRVNGLLRCLIYGMDLDTFFGKFLEVSTPVRRITGVVGSDADGNAVDVLVQLLQRPDGLKILIG